VYRWWQHRDLYRCLVPAGEGVLAFGEVVRGHRRRLGLTQDELAGKAGISPRHIRLIEAGRIAGPRPGTVRMLAEAFGLAGVEREAFQASAASGAEPATDAGERSEARPVPAQLPLDVPGFAGRQVELARLDAVMVGVGERPAAVVVSALAGTAGVGKTALAVHWAHRVRDRFPDGQLYVNLRGFDPDGAVLDPGVALRGLLDALGVAPQRIPGELDAQAGLYRSLLAGRRMLILLDNARDADQVRPLLPGEPGSVVIVTSRNQLNGLIAAHAAHPVVLDLLTVDEARTLLARRLGASRIAAEPRAVDELINACARLPIALAIVAAHAAAHPSFPLATLCERLRNAEGLDGFAGSDAATDVRAIFSWSYRILSDDAARLFRLLGLHPGPDIAAPAAASLAGVPIQQARTLLAELTRAHLLSEHSPGRYTFHDLLRAFATEVTQVVDPEQQRREALGRLLDHYLHTGRFAALLLRSERRPINLAPPRPGATVESLTTLHRAMEWFTTERSALLAAIRTAADLNLHRHAWQLAWVIEDYLDRQGHWHDLLTTEHTAFAAASAAHDRLGQALTNDGLARAHTRLGMSDRAELHLGQALCIYRELGDQIGVALCHANYEVILRQRTDRRREALHHARQALELFRCVGDQAGQAMALNSVGWAHARIGEYPEALEYSRQALQFSEGTGGLTLQAMTRHTIGYAHHHLGDYEQAAAHYRQALKVCRDTGNRPYEGVTLAHLGDTYEATGDHEAARTCRRQALEILDELHHPDAAEVRAKLEQS